MHNALENHVLRNEYGTFMTKHGLFLTQAHLFNFEFDEDDLLEIGLARCFVIPADKYGHEGESLFKINEDY